jgi:hypothetical protein
VESAALAGADLKPGDVIIRAGSTAAPNVLQVRRFLAQPAPSGLAVLIVRRDGQQRVVAIPAGARVDGR